MFQINIGHEFLKAGEKRKINTAAPMSANNFFNLFTKSLNVLMNISFLDTFEAMSKTKFYSKPGLFQVLILT